MAFVHLQSAWRFRHFVISAIRGEMKARFASSKIGWFWFVLHPLAMAAIYALVLSKVLGARIEGVASELGYSVFLMAGIAGWSLFAEILSRSVNIFVEYGEKLKKISFPRSSLPLIVIGGALISQAFLIVAMLIVFLLLGYPPAWTWFSLPLGMLTAVGLAIGLGLLLGTFNVFSRDVTQVITVVLNLWFWLTPIVYPTAIISESLLLLVGLNPMAPVVQFYQEAILYRTWPDIRLLVYPTLLAILLCSLAAFVFHRASAEIVDSL